MMSAAGPPQGARPLGGSERSSHRGEHIAAGPPQGARPLGGSERSSHRGELIAAGPPQGARPLLEGVREAASAAGLGEAL